MDSERIHVRLLTSDGLPLDAVLTVSAASPWEVSLDIGNSTFFGAGDDLFDALVELRKELGAKGVSILCQGAAKNVYPSRMSRQMGGARRAYKLTLGRQAFFPDLVDIFDPASPEEIASVDDQKAFFVEWIGSLK